MYLLVCFGSLSWIVETVTFRVGVLDKCNKGGFYMSPYLRSCGHDSVKNDQLWGALRRHPTPTHGQFIRTLTSSVSSSFKSTSTSGTWAAQSTHQKISHHETLPFPPSYCYTSPVSSFCFHPKLPGSTSLKCMCNRDHFTVFSSSDAVLHFVCTEFRNN